MHLTVEQCDQDSLLLNYHEPDYTGAGTPTLELHPTASIDRGLDSFKRLPAVLKIITYQAELIGVRVFAQVFG